MEEEEEGWSRLWDETSQHWYWYNEYTEESRWEETGGSYDTTNEEELTDNTFDEKEESNIYHEKSLTVQKKNMNEGDKWKNVQSQWKKLGMVENAEGEESRFQPSISSNNIKNDEYESSSSDDDNDENVLISSVKEKQPIKDDPTMNKGWDTPKKSKKQLRYNRIINDTKDAVSCYQYCFYFHAFLFEAPLTIAESIISGTFCLFISWILISFSLLLSLIKPILKSSRNHHREIIQERTLYIQKRCRFLAKIWAREGLLYYGAVITLTILPCSIATYVYKDFQENDDDLQEREKWNMLPLPSICGSIDPRRFACISLCGQGGDAGNADMPLLASDNIEMTAMNQDGTLADINSATHSNNNNNSLNSGYNNSSSNSSNRSSSIEDMESSLNADVERLIGFQGGMDAWEGNVLIAPRNFDRIFTNTFISNFMKSILSIFDSDVNDPLNGRELLSTIDDDDDDDDEEDEDEDDIGVDLERGN